MNNFPPSPPVDTLLDIAEEKGLSVEQLSEYLNISDVYMKNIIDGVYPISFIATLLSEKFNTTVEFWLAREGLYIKALNNKIETLEQELFKWKRYDALIEGKYYGKPYTGVVEASSIVDGLIVYLVRLSEPIIEKQYIYVVESEDDFRFLNSPDWREVLLQNDFRI